MKQNLEQTEQEMQKKFKPNAAAQSKSNHLLTSSVTLNVFAILDKMKQKQREKEEIDRAKREKRKVKQDSKLDKVLMQID